LDYPRVVVEHVGGLGLVDLMNVKLSRPDLYSTWVEARAFWR
jgi:hypothetical protein